MDKLVTIIVRLDINVVLNQKVTKRTQFAMVRSFRSESFVSVAVEHQRLINVGISICMTTFHKNKELLSGFSSYSAAPKEISIDGRVGVIRKTGERFDKNHVVQTYKFEKGFRHGLGVVVSGGRGIDPLVTIKGNIDCLKQYFLP
ncbi:hypothetical protein PHYBLDRAFT_67765 [Phycomyces blakesleeanus NRRL 1555(-)]|uniref:Uncharacterized protein n=1 Tax=Phycomyces blakesleeanus (strain ATCC 8743b / DSM 1359 / FGSC 10004 / NBRC 33097 / NRRL 1555) TaxID=763407 RepID=A0A162PQA8_PHYB8|nr:hypothetical protein PHYBLDRAFT_67765 [Phycomyces blakesleeanus NRRL 1555(-)]OAD74997.1 hypothetical protein PHYBLDRAFT_67765 [Phycomyces blakesleeanus NRRL 1555(-)]|eukprot:XP_018293037.1 hypothetical protein PHYBLDRAFT_67765 [Phycomyces blakesleeanus NRRL 1555(-)]